LIEQLTLQAAQRILKSSSTEPAPGTAINDPNKPSEAETASQGSQITGSVDTKSKCVSKKTLKQGIEEQKRNADFQLQFNLPNTEHLELELVATFTCAGLSGVLGRLFLSSNFLSFVNTDSNMCWFTLPLFVIRRVEKTTSTTNHYVITFITWDQYKVVLQLAADDKLASKFTESLKHRLTENIARMKTLKPFLKSCFSEALHAGIADKEPSGLGPAFGYPGL
jgi:hypothetical protein